MDFLENINAHFIVLLCHHNADPDAVCAAYAFSNLLKRLRPGIDLQIAAAQGPSKLSKNILKFLPVKLVDEPCIEKADVLVLLDTNTIQQLDDWGVRVKRSKKPLIVIDHHIPHPETLRIASLCIANEESSSTCEIVYELFKEAKIKPTAEDALTLFLGIAYDTRHFTIASSQSFKVVAALIEEGVKAEEALPILAVPMNNSERIARLKAAQRMELVRVNEWLIAYSRVSAYQASAARALLRLGAHVAVVGGERNDALSISMRACRLFYEKTAIHLGRDLAKPIGDFINGMGGGHATSAGANGRGSLESVFERCTRLLRDRLR